MASAGLEDVRDRRMFHPFTRAPRADRYSSAQDEFECLAEVMGNAIAARGEHGRGRPAYGVVRRIVLDVTKRSKINQRAVDGGTAHVGQGLEELGVIEGFGEQCAEHKHASGSRKQLLKSDHPLRGVLHQGVRPCHALNCGVIPRVRGLRTRSRAPCRVEYERTSFFLENNGGGVSAVWGIVPPAT